MKFISGYVIVKSDSPKGGAYPEGSFESDMAKVLGGSRVGRVRSLRRALRRLCDSGEVTMAGEGSRREPHRYWFNVVSDRDVAAFPNAAHLGGLLLEARCQMPHKEFYDWVKQEFKITPAQAEQLIDAAYQTRRSPASEQPSDAKD